MLTIQRAGFLISLICLAWAMFRFAPTQYYEEALWGWAFVGLAVVALGVAGWRSTIRDEQPIAALPDSQPRIARKTLIAGLIGLLIAIQGSIGGTRYEGIFSPHLQVPAFVVGLLLVFAGLAGYSWADIGGGWAWAKHTLPNQLRPWLRRNRALVGIIALATVVRVINLEFGLHRLVDEIHFMTAVGDLRSGANIPMLTPHGGVTAFTWFYPYLQTLLVDIFGAGLSPLRIVSAAFGVAQVAALYALIRATFDRPTALVAALLLATFPPHVHFSRIGLNNIVDPLFGLLAMWCLVRGMQTKKQFYYVAGGILLGLTHYFYEGGRLFYTPFVLAWLGWLLLMTPYAQRGRLPTPRQLMLFGAALLITLIPMYYVWAFFNLPFTPRFEASGGSFKLLSSLLLSSQPHLILWDKLQAPLMFYTYVPEEGSFYTGHRIILYETLPLFLMGWGLCFWRGRSVGGGLLFWWVVAQMIAIAFVKGTFATPRYCVVYPALAAVMAVGLVQGWQMGVALWQQRDAAGNKPDTSRLAKTMLLPVLIGAGIALYQGWLYPAVILPRYYQLQFYEEYHENGLVKDSEDALFRMVTLPPATDVYFIGSYLHGGSGFWAFLNFFGRGKITDLRLETLTPEQVTDELLRNTIPDRTQAFFIDPLDSVTIQRLRDYFPTLEGPIFSPHAVAQEKQFALYRVAPQKPF